MSKSPDEQLVSMINNLAEKTGKSVEEWLKIARASKFAKHGEIVKHLKSEHGLTHGYANLVAAKALESAAGAPAGEDLVEAQFAGAKAALRSIYDALVEAIGKFGTDVELAPKKAYVSVRRNKQFAILQPSTASRFDVGINLKGIPPSGRLEASGSFNSMVTHRVRISDRKEVDKELVGWLKQAYDAA
jgi:hypothetical protein